MDNLTPEQRRKNMQNVRSTNSLPERIICKVLEKHRYIFSKNDLLVFGKPDIIFKKRKVAIFIDSDFWHGNPKRFIMPKSNKKYWKNKISNNRKRDKLVTRKLRAQGWTVLRFWEYDIKKNLPKCINKIVKTLSIKQF
jgi:DNA mismatch endonuclease (patch repair protein)